MSAARASFGITVLFVALVATGPMSVDLYLPALPEMMRVFHTDVSGVQLTLSVFAFTTAAAQLIYGPLSDRFGRRPMLIAGVVLYTVGGMLCLTAGSIGSLVAFRVIQALGGCAGPVLARASVRDLYPREQVAHMLSLMATAMSIAPAVAPMAGGTLIEFGWRANFCVMVGFGLLLCFWVWRVYPETNAHPDPHALRPGRIIQVFSSLIRDPVYVGCTASVAFAFGGIFSFVSLSSFVLIDVLDVAPNHFGFYFGIPMVGFVTGSFVASRLAHRWPLERTIRIGSIIGATAGLVMLGLALFRVQSVPAVIAPQIFIALAVGLVLPNSTAAALGPHARVAGTASALIGAVQMSFGAFVGWLAGKLHDGTTLPLAAFMAGCWLATALVQAGLYRRARRLAAIPAPTVAE